MVSYMERALTRVYIDIIYYFIFKSGRSPMLPHVHIYPYRITQWISSLMELTQICTKINMAVVKASADINRRHFPHLFFILFFYTNNKYSVISATVTKKKTIKWIRRQMAISSDKFINKML